MQPTLHSLQPRRPNREHYLAGFTYPDLAHLYGRLHRCRCAVCSRLAPALGLAWADLQAEAGA